MLAAALALLLAGCGAGEPEAGASPSLEPSQPVTAAPRLPETPGPLTEELEPSPALTPEEILARQPVDDTHDAFLVDTGGKLGTLLVTVELGEREQDLELRETPLYIAIWNPADMSEAIQEMESTIFNVFHRYAELDANFDGNMDFSYMYFVGNQPNYWYLWIWDEEAGQFVEVPEYREISGPRCNPQTGIIDGFARNSGAGDGTTTFHRWEDGKLVCIRRIKLWWEPDEEILTEEEITVFPMHITVEDRIDGELTLVYSEVLAPDVDYLSERAKWENLDYHGEN